MALHIGRSLLNKRLKGAKKTQLDLAEYLGVNQSFISMVATNRRKFSYDQAAHTAHFLGCSMEDLHERKIT